MFAERQDVPANVAVVPTSSLTGTFPPAHVVGIAVGIHRLGTTCLLHCLEKNRFGTASRKEALSAAALSWRVLWKPATNSFLIFAPAGRGRIFRFTCGAEKTSRLTGTSAVLLTSYEASSASWARSIFTSQKRRIWLAFNTCFRMMHRKRAPFRRLKRSRTSLPAFASFFLLPLVAHAAPLPLQRFAQLAISCAPHVAVETLAAIARTESGFDALTLHDNSTKRTYHPASPEDAIALGVELVTVDGHSVDLGLMQINSANLLGLSLTVADGFEPCRNLAAADRVLVEGYTAPSPGQDVQPAVEQTLSHYNTGDPARGFANGYVSRVQASAELVVPALRIQGDAVRDQAAAVSGEAPVMAQPLPPLLPSWDVYARAKTGHSQVFGASPVPVTPVSVAAAAPSVSVGPAPARRLSIEAMNNVR